MSQIPKAPSELTGNLSNAQKQAKQEGFDLVFNKDPKDKPKLNNIVKTNPAMRKMFNSIVKLNKQYFSESDSDDINTLVVSLYQKQIQEQRWLQLDETHQLDDDYERLQIRIDKLDKKIDNARKNLNLTMNTKFRLANEMYKTILQEKQVQQMEQQNQIQTINPLLALLEDDDE